MLIIRLVTIGWILIPRLGANEGKLTQMMITWLITIAFFWLTGWVPAGEYSLRCWLLGSPTLVVFWPRGWVTVMGYWLKCWPPGWSALVEFWLTGWAPVSGYWLRCWSPLDGFWLTDWAPIRGYWLRWWSPGWSPLLFADSGWVPTWEYSLRCWLPGADSTNDILWAAYTKILMHAHCFYILLWHVILDYVEPQIR